MNPKSALLLLGGLAGGLFFLAKNASASTPAVQSKGPLGSANNPASTNYGRTPGAAALESDPLPGVNLAGIATKPGSVLPAGVVGSSSGPVPVAWATTLGPNTKAYLNAIAYGNQDGAAYYAGQITKGFA